VLVVTPRRDSIDEGLSFAARLGQSDIPVQALIVNRLHPKFDARLAATRPFAANRKLDWSRSGLSVQAFTNLNANWAELRAMARREESSVTALAVQLAPAPVARVPLLDGDVHDLDGVQTVADHLFGMRDSKHRFINPGTTTLRGKGKPTSAVISPLGAARTDRATRNV
jgi:anion-transporting  ArsA/GET3 family ATPase